MKATEAAALLTIAAAYDNRKPDADQARAWALALDDLRFEDCRTAIVEHYKVSREWLMPLDVRSGVKRIRAARLSEFGMLPDPPASLDPDDTGALHAWLLATRRAIADGELTVADVRPIEAAEVPEARERLRELRRKAASNERDGMEIA